jgi:hypothetical protein
VAGVDWLLAYKVSKMVLFTVAGICFTYLGGEYIHCSREIKEAEASIKRIDAIQKSNGTLREAIDG